MTRRSFLHRAALAGLCLTTTACGATPSGGGQATRSVGSLHGPIQVPARANRVVCLDLSKIQRMLDVGVRPVAVPTGWQALATEADWYATVPKIGSQAAIDVETLAAARPDVLLGSPQSVSDRLYQQLSALAPTIVLDAPGAGARWPQLADADADAVGRGLELDGLHATYRDRLAALRTLHADVLGRTRWAMAYGQVGSAYEFLATAGPGIVLTDLGVRLVAPAAVAAPVFRQLSYERLDDLAEADVILLDAQADGSLTAATTNLRATPTFAALRASRTGGVHPLSRLLVFSYGEALALLDQIDQILTGMAR